uniref:Uncharacterized protein n=1 Tax=Oryza sativa subsp. japonica TaxID=39947 RepID=Q337Q5_ORYSJ|nr:hypothetical protein LOC_Os10g31159 [Oryza sativa Japonica Group]
MASSAPPSFITFFPANLLATAKVGSIHANFKARISSPAIAV